MLRKLYLSPVGSALLILIFPVFVQATTVLAQERAAKKIAGYVIDNKGSPLTKVSISMQGKLIGESGKDGSFSVAPVGRESRIALTFALEGYVSNTRIYDTKAAGNGNTVVIWPKAYRIKFDAGREFDVELGSSRIKIPAGGLTGFADDKVKNQAVLYFTLFDVTDRSQRAAAPGDFSAQMKDGSIRRLNSYGIFELGLYDLRGRPLNLRPEAKIDLSIAIPPKLAGAAPKQVGYFDFEDKTGRWLQVGSFQYVPSTLTYNGSVTSFGGSHNLDDPQDTTCITVQVVNMYDGSPMPNFYVTAHGPQYDSYGTTDNSGFVCLLVQRNATFTVEAVGNLGGNTWGTPNQPTFNSPNFSSGASDCGNGCTTCPFLGTVPEDFLVGLTQPQRFMNGNR